MAGDNVLLPPLIWAGRIDGKTTGASAGDSKLLPPPHVRTGLGATGETGTDIGESGGCAGATEVLPPPPLPPAPRTAPRGAGIRKPNEPCDPFPATDGIGDSGGGTHEPPVLATLPFEDGGNQELSGIAGAVPDV